MAGSHIITRSFLSPFTSKGSMRSGRLYENITQAIANVCGDWSDHDRLDCSCSILLASLTLLCRKTAITEKIGAHEFCFALATVLDLGLK